MGVDLKNRPSSAAGTSILAAALLAACSALRTPALLNELNGTSAPAQSVPRIDLATRIARLAKAHMADAYIDPQPQRITARKRIKLATPATFTIGAPFTP